MRFADALTLPRAALAWGRCQHTLARDVCLTSQPTGTVPVRCALCGPFDAPHLVLALTIPSSLIARAASTFRIIGLDVLFCWQVLYLPRGILAPTVIQLVTWAPGGALSHREAETCLDSRRPPLPQGSFPSLLPEEHLQLHALPSRREFVDATDGKIRVSNALLSRRGICLYI